jgi:hypothetical protein
MKSNNRFLKSVLKTAQADKTPALPWTRGATRQAMIAKRHQPEPQPRIARSA